jgi:hypothetical protein
MTAIAVNLPLKMMFGYVSFTLKLAVMDAYKSDNLVAKISSIEVSPTDYFWQTRPMK